MIARRTALLFLGLLAAALPAAAQTSPDRGLFPAPRSAADLAGGDDGGDAGGPWPGAGVSVRIFPWRRQQHAMDAAALLLPRRLLLAWPAWDGHDTEIVVAALGGGAPPRSIRVTRNGGGDEEPILVAAGDGAVLAWVHREGGRRTLRAVRLAADGTPAGDERTLGPAGRARLVDSLPDGRLVALVLRGPAGRPRLDLLVEGGTPSPVARLGREAALLEVRPGEGGAPVFRFRDGALAGRLTVGPEGTVQDLVWGED